MGNRLVTVALVLIGLLIGGPRWLYQRCKRLAQRINHRRKQA